MSTTLKKNFLKLLDKDIEFRYAVAGYLGLSEILKRFDEHDKKFNEISERLEIHDKKFSEILEVLEKYSKDLSDIKSYIERTSLTLEEEAREVLTRKFKNLGIDVKLSSLILPDIEINIYGIKDDLCIIGETSTRAGVKVISLIDENTDKLKEKYSEYLRKKIIKVVYTMWATEDAIEEAKKRNIWLVKATEDLTPLIF